MYSSKESSKITETLNKRRRAKEKTENKGKASKIKGFTK